MDLFNPLDVSGGVLDDLCIVMSDVLALEGFAGPVNRVRCVLLAGALRYVM